MPFRTQVLWRSKTGVEGIALDPRSGTIGVYAGDAGVTVLRRDGTPLWQERGLRLRAERWAFTRDGEHLALASNEFELDLRRAADGARATPAHWAAAKSSTWQLSPDARFVAVAVSHDQISQIAGMARRKVNATTRMPIAARIVAASTSAWLAPLASICAQIWATISVSLNPQSQ